jgi:hypothetical protein
VPSEEHTGPPLELAPLVYKWQGSRSSYRLCGGGRPDGDDGGGEVRSALHPEYILEVGLYASFKYSYTQDEQNMPERELLR